MRFLYTTVLHFCMACVAFSVVIVDRAPKDAACRNYSRCVLLDRRKHQPWGTEDRASTGRPIIQSAASKARSVARQKTVRTTDAKQRLQLEVDEADDEADA